MQSGRPLNCFGNLDLNPGLPLRDANGVIISVPGSSRRYSPHPYGASFFRCGTTVEGALNDPTVQRFPRGTKGRLPWTQSLDLNVAYTPSWAPGLTIKADVFNVMNSQKVTSVNEVAETRATGLPLNTYLLPNSFQAARSFRFMVQYEF